MCYICHFRGTGGEVVNHTLTSTCHVHLPKQTFSMRRKCLDHCSGQEAFSSLHYTEPIEVMLQNIKSGMKLYFDEQTRKIHYKRPIAEDKNITDSQTITEDADIYNLLPYVIDQLQQMDRLSDFVSLLHAIKNSYILKNIAFHLLLDVSNFYSKTSISSMRYSKESLSFWLTVHKLFKQRGINFFRGYKAESFGKEGCVKPSEFNLMLLFNPSLCELTLQRKEQAKRVEHFMQS